MAEKKMMVVVGAKISDFQKGMNTLQKGLRSTGRKLKSIGGDLTKTITAPIVAIGTVAMKASIEYESAFADVRKTVTATDAELATLSKGIRNMAKEIPLAATEIAGIAASAGQLGIETKNIEGFTRVMADLAVATNMTSEQASTDLARLANITGMSQTEFDRLGSTVVALGNNLATTESEIVAMGLRIAGAGKQVGMTEDQILSFAGALSSVGIEAQAGGSSISKMMIEMQLATEKGGKKLQQFAKVAGMTSADFKTAFEKDATGAIVTFIQGLADAESQGKTAIGILDEMGITEVRLRDTLLRAAGASDVFTEAIDLGSKAWEENTALTDEAEEKYATTASQLVILKNKANDAAIELGDTLGPTMRDVVIPTAEKLIGKVGNMVDKFAALSPEAQKSRIAMLGFAAAVPVGLVVMGQLAGSLANVIELVKIISAFKYASVFGWLATAVGAAWSLYEALSYTAKSEGGNVKIDLGFSGTYAQQKQIGEAVLKADKAAKTKAAVSASGSGYTTGKVGRLQGLATGTPAVTNAGIFRVGENGPETVFLPKGAAVAPDGGGGELNGTLTIQLTNDRGEITDIAVKAVKDVLRWEGM